MKKSANSKKPRTELRNGCSRTEVFVSPKNYKSLRNKSDLKKDWFVECRFYDPNFAGKYPNGFQFRKRLNGYETIIERKEAAEVYRDMMLIELDDKHFNPITKSYMHSETGEFSPNMDAYTALEEARKKIDGSESHKKQIRCCVARVNQAMKSLNYDFLNISDIRLFHIKNTLEYLKLPEYTYNKYRQYLKKVFDELIEYGCVESNPCRDISKKKHTPELREIISEDQLKFIDPYLKSNFPDFYRYRMIFGFSAGRSAELLRVKKKDVNIEKQEFIVQIQKGKKYVWATKIITLDAVPFWREILDMAQSNDDYLFAKGLVPGSKPIKPYQITKRWDRLVKKSDKIKNDNGEILRVTADFYTLKHKFLDALDAIDDMAPILPLARTAANHTSDRTTGIYATGRQSRANERLKQLRLSS